MAALDAIIAASAELEGATLTRQEVSRLLRDGVSTFGKTMQEQQLCLDLAEAYRRGCALADAGDNISPYRLRELASTALRSLDVPEYPGGPCLQEASNIIREVRLHVNTLSADESAKAAFRLHFLLSKERPWGERSNLVGRLMMNVLQYALGQEPMAVEDGADYLRVLGVALSQDIEEIFVNHMLERLHSPRRPRPGGDVSRKKVVAFERKATTRETILSMLSAHPYMSAADIAAALDITPKGVEKQLRILKADGLLRRIGPDKGGHWEVTRQD